MANKHNDAFTAGPQPKAQASQKTGGKTVGVRGPGHLLCDSLSYIWQWSCTQEISTTWSLTQDQHSDNIRWCTSMAGGSLTRASPTPRWRAFGNQWLLREGESIFSRDEVPSSRVVIPEHLHIWATQNGFSKLHILTVIKGGEVTRGSGGHGQGGVTR